MCLGVSRSGSLTTIIFSRVFKKNETQGTQMSVRLSVCPSVHDTGLPSPPFSRVSREQGHCRVRLSSERKPTCVACACISWFLLSLVSFPFQSRHTVRPSRPEPVPCEKPPDKSVAHDFGQWSRGDLTRRRRRVRYQTRTRMQHAHGIKWRRLQLADDDNIYNKRDWISVFTSHLAITSSQNQQELCRETKR